MTREEKAARARELRDQGLLRREVAEQMGVALSTAGSWLDDADGSRLRARKDSYRGTCEVCGATTSGSEGRGPNAPRICRPCMTRRLNAAGVAYMRAVARPRYERIAELWARGASLVEIAENVGTTKNALSTAMVRMRAQGWDLPHRYSMHDGKRVAA